MPRGKKKKRSAVVADDSLALFDLTPVPATTPDPDLEPVERPLWTENKARFIDRYLRYFTYVTKHGTYIDGFAGPQEETDATDIWSARLVLQSEPWRLRQFFLFDQKKAQVDRLKELRDAQRPRGPKDPKRRVEIFHGDFNERVAEVLTSEHIRETEATFCLLDQRTFECRWTTVERIARHKKGVKIEIFYFLANGWLDRALAARTKEESKKEIEQWWGGSDWRRVLQMQRLDRAQAFVQKFRQLGYVSAKAWPIYKRQSGREVMYYMIHATDHPLAPGLMRRAYENAVRPIGRDKQLSLLAQLFGEGALNE